MYYNVDTETQDRQCTTTLTQKHKTGNVLQR